MVITMSNQRDNVNLFINGFESEHAFVSSELFFFINGRIGEAPNKCMGCSACCRFCGEPPFESIDEIKRLPPFLRDELLAHHNSILGTTLLTRGAQNLPCMWLDIESNTCRNYKYRPAVCYNFIIGSTECKHFIQLNASGSF